MKKFLACVLSASMMLGLLAGCAGAGSSSGNAPAGSGAAVSTPAVSGDNVLKIGVFEPSTGDSASGGKKEMLGMQYANSETPTVTVGGQEYQIQLVYADNGSSTDKALTAATQLVSEGVSLVLGSYGSGVSMAGGTVFAEAGVPAIGVTCTNPQVTSDCDVYFRICFLDPFQGTVLANYAYKELGVDTAYLLGMLGSDYDQGLIYYFTQAFEKLGGTVVAENFPEGNANFVSYINNAKAANAGVIFSPVSINYAQLIVEAAAAQGFEGTILGGDTLDSNMVVEAAKGKDVDVKITTFYQEGGNPEFDAGIKEWINANADAKTNNGGNDMVSAVTVMGYDAYFTALEAIKAAGSTAPADILAALPGVTYSGISGEIAFDDIGDAKRDAAYIKTANTETGAWDFVKIQGID